MNQFYKNIALWLVIGLIMIALFNLFNQPLTPIKEVIFSDFMNQVSSGNVEEVVVQGDYIKGKLQDGEMFRTNIVSDPELIKFLREKNVRIKIMPPEETTWYANLLISWFPMLLLLGVWIFFMRQMQSGGGKALSFGKSRAKLLSQQKKKATFKDVAGVDEAKEELQEIIEFLKEPQKFQKLGGKIPKGVLVMGPPGTGKTLLARAIAGEANVPFFNISGSEFVEMFVGVGASRVRDLFEQGKKNAPCIIFIDEIDAVGRHRGAGLGGGHDEREQTLNQLLVEMDGFASNEGVILIAATNRPDVLDPALMRPGRFDRQVVVPRPDIRGREGILKVHTMNIPIEEDVKLAVLSRGTPGFSGADLENMVNEAALMAARQEKDLVAMEDFENAKDKVMMGVERRSMIISDEEKRNTAFHEAGHVLVAKLIPGTDPVHKVTIIPRGRALGLTMQLPVDERHTYPVKYLMDRLAVLFGGRAAEEIALNQITTGAGNDIEQGTDLARKMICEWGMSETMGPLAYGKKEEQIFLGREISQHKDYSEATAIAIDKEVKELVAKSYERAKKLVRENKKTLDKLAEALLERESLGSHEVDVIVFGKIKADELAKKEAKAKAAVIAEQENSIEAKSESNTKPEPATKPETNPVGKKDD
ncbi:MAG TPA: ATP-dependent zinc metalloprotease FtsH [Nitrospinota bacterium]|jgi:cell division protease FtsH|nr:ATP-dependent zinc metalloprotease FtsH [Nitrospinota bacterium]